METVISVLIGAAVTWGCSWWYYQRAAEDLREEAAELRDLSTKMWEHLQGVQSFAGRKPSAPTT